MTRRGEDEEAGRTVEAEPQGNLFKTIFDDDKTIARAESRLEASGLDKKEVDPRRWTYLVTAMRATLAALCVAEQAASEKHLSAAWRVHDQILRGNEAYARGAGLNLKEAISVTRLDTADDILAAQDRHTQIIRAAICDLKEVNPAEYQKLEEAWQQRKNVGESALPSISYP